MIRLRAPAASPRQRGAAALAVALILLFGMTLIAFFANRGMIFEQRTSANQYRATSAFEVAEAGLEWAVARLNDNALLTSTACAGGGVAGTNSSFGETYLPITSPTAGFAVSALQTGCSVAADGTRTCGCPTIASPTLTLGAKDDPRFTVQFSGGGDPWTVQVQSFGCTNASADGAVCGTGAGADAIAVVRALYKMKPTVPNAPGAGLVTGSYTAAGGSLTVTNLDVASNGITINSGSTIEVGSAIKVNTLAGTPPRASVLDNDSSLSALTNADVSGDAFFSSFFGETIDRYQNNAKTWVITDSNTVCPSGASRCTRCTTESSCGTAVSAAINAGEFRFWLDTDVSWTTSNVPTAGTLGTPSKPIVVASSADIKIGSSVVGYGMFYSANSIAEEIALSGGGNAKIFGAIVSRGGFEKQGGGDFNLIYDPNIFAPGDLRGLMVRVPGSWRDKASEYN